MIRTALRALLAALLLAAPAAAQAPDQRGEVVLSTPAYRGETASAPIPPEYHIKNEGGSDGSGLCVIASMLLNGMYQGVPALAGGKDSDLWRAAKAAPGGYWPEKWARLIERVMPGEKYVSYYGPDTAVLDKLSREGYAIGATMNTGKNYGYRRIAHMVSLIHYRLNQWACVVDNNFPGVYSWMPSGEYDRRWKDGGEGWAMAWLRKPPAAAGGAILPVLLALAALLLIGARRRREALGA